MMNTEEIRKISLKENFVNKRFRTIEREDLELSHARNEVLILINVDAELDRQLSFRVPKRKQLFAYTVLQGELAAINQIKRILLEKERDKYVMTIEREKVDDIRFLFDVSELADVLEHALRVPSQHILK